MTDFPPNTSREPQGARLFRFRSADGLSLAAWEWGDAASPHLPVVCLPGLTRNARDFEVLAQRLAADPVRPRRVIAFEFRGRGWSDHDPNPANYDPAREAADTLAGLAALGLERVLLVGTSRGGIVSTFLAGMKPGLLAGVVLNDIGSVIDIEGLTRIRAYVGKIPALPNRAVAVHALKSTAARDFVDVTDDDWARFVNAIFAEQPDGTMVLDYDPALAESLKLKPDEVPASIELWEAFDLLAPLPVLIVRGLLSDLLSEATVKAMLARMPRAESYDVAGQGHAPLLTDAASAGVIADFLRRAEDAGPTAG